MDAAVDRLEFAPPATPGWLRAFGLALLAHAFLLAALTWGVHWKNEALNVTAEAELWSAVPQQAAPKLVDMPPEPQEPPKPVKALPLTLPTPPQVQPMLPDADIALEREKLRRKKEKEKQQELEKQRLETQRLEKLKLEKLEKVKQEKRLQERRLQDKRDQDKKAAEDKKKSDQDSKRKEAIQAQQDVKKLEAQRADNLKRIAGLAGATGAPGATGTAQHATGPSASYGQRLAALFKRNLNYPNPESISGNPKARVEVRVSASGLIMSSRLITSSGVPSWDTAALHAVEKTERIPADENGNFVPVFPVNFGPKD